MRIRTRSINKNKYDDNVFSFKIAELKEKSRTYGKKRVEKYKRSDIRSCFELAK